MSRRVRLCAQGEVPEGGARCFTVDDHPPVALFNVAGAIHATADTCTHQRASLTEGDIEGEEVICPLHFQVFHIPTGEAREGVTKQPLATYPVVLDGDDIYVELP